MKQKQKQKRKCQHRHKAQAPPASTVVNEASSSQVQAQNVLGNNYPLFAQLLLVLCCLLGIENPKINSIGCAKRMPWCHGAVLAQCDCYKKVYFSALVVLKMGSFILVFVALIDGCSGIKMWLLADFWLLEKRIHVHVCLF